MKKYILMILSGILALAWSGLLMAQTDVSVRVAVIPFEIFSMEETPSLGKDLSIQLSQQLALNPRILTCNYNIIQPLIPEKKGAVLDQKRLQEMAAALDAHFIVCGSLTKIQNDLSLDIQVFNNFDKESYFKTFAEGTRLDAIIREVSGKIEQDMMKKAALIPPAALPKVAAAPKEEILEEVPSAATPEKEPERTPAPQGPAVPEEKKSAPPKIAEPSPLEQEIEETTREEKPAATEPVKKAAAQPVTARKEPTLPSPPKEEAREKKGGPSFGGSNLPVNIHADSLEYDNKQNRVAFNGHVVARQGDMVIFADSMRVTYEDKGKLKQIEALGGVKMIQGDRIATGDTIVFYNDQQKVVLTGNPRVWQGDNVINGEKITVFIKEERSIVEGSTANRVSATIVPKKKEQSQTKQVR